MGCAKREAPPKRGLSVIQSVGAKVSAPTTIPCHTVCGLQTPVISVGQRSRKLHRQIQIRLQRVKTRPAPGAPIRTIQDSLRTWRRAAGILDPANLPLGLPGPSSSARRVYPVVKSPLSLARARTTDGPG